MTPWPSVGDVYAEVAERNDILVSPAVLNRNFARAWKELRQFNHRREEWAALVDATFVKMLDLPPSKTFFPQIYDRFAEPSAWRVFDDVKPALESLAARGVKLGIISNWDDRLRPLLAKLDLAKYFEVIVISCEVGFTKPSPVIFEQASRNLGLAPELILHVGDSREHDFAGAKAAGFKAALLERDVDSEGQEVVRSLAEI